MFIVKMIIAGIIVNGWFIAMAFIQEDSKRRRIENK